MTVDAASAALQRVHHEFEPVLSENNSPLTKKVGTPNRQRATVFGVPAQLGLDLRRKALARSSPSQILREVLVFAPRVPNGFAGLQDFLGLPSTQVPEREDGRQVLSTGRLAGRGPYRVNLSERYDYPWPVSASTQPTGRSPW